MSVARSDAPVGQLSDGFDLIRQPLRDGHGEKVQPSNDAQPPAATVEGRGHALAHASIGADRTHEADALCSADTATSSGTPRDADAIRKGAPPPPPQIAAPRPVQGPALHGDRVAAPPPYRVTPPWDLPAAWPPPIRMVSSSDQRPTPAPTLGTSPLVPSPAAVDVDRSDEQVSRATRKAWHALAMVPTVVSPKPTDRDQRRTLKVELRAAQRRRMRSYEEAAAETTAPTSARRAKVRWTGLPSTAPSRTIPYARTQSPVAPVAASAFMIPPPPPPRSPSPISREPSIAPVEAAVAQGPVSQIGDGCAECGVDDDVRGGDRHNSVARDDPARPKAVLVLFAGRDRQGSLRRVLRRLGFRTVTFELMDDECEQDLSKGAIQSRVLESILNDDYDFVWMAPPCSTFSPALWPRVRSLLEPMGVRTLSGRSLERVQLHNNLVEFVSRVINVAESQDVQWAVENPAVRRYGPTTWARCRNLATIWDTPPMRRALRHATAGMVTFAQCAFCSDYQKLTALAVSAASVASFERCFAWATCACESHAKVAKGRDANGESLSAPAAAYPPRMNEAIGLAIVGALRVREPAEFQTGVRGLEMGSADPHVLRLDDDRVPAVRRHPTFSLQAHEPATDAELLARPLPSMNAAPSTTRRDPEPRSEGAPTNVRTLEDLLPTIWIQRLRTWMRRTRRCIRLASAGDWHRARRMRPPDMWVPAEAMHAHVRPWNWDLRPWAEGGEAVPTDPTGPNSPPVVGFDWRAVRDSDPGFADQEIVGEMLDGIADDVDAPRGSFLCAPHSGALRFYSEADSRLRAGVAEGWASEHAELPFWPIRCDPYSVVDESLRAGTSKYRLTNDHSWPQPGMMRVRDTADDAWTDLRSLNDAMDRSTWPQGKMIRVQQLAESAAILQQAGVPVRAGVLDVKAYYKQFARQRSEWYRNGAITDRGYMVDERCCFGSAADAVKCCRISSFIVHHARRAMAEVDARYPTRDPRVLAWLEKRRAAAAAAGGDEADYTTLYATGMYVDDAANVSIDDDIYTQDGAAVMRDGKQVTRALLHFEAMRDTFLRFGLVPTKEQPPAAAVVFLGICIDLDAGRMRLTDGKRKRYADASEQAASATSVSRPALMSLLGKLVAASACYPRGRQWLNAAWRSLRARYRTDRDVVVLSSSAVEGLRRWATELRAEHHDGVPLASRDAMPPADSDETVCVYADASLESGTCGFGAWTVVGNELLYIIDEWSDVEKTLLICDLELAASTFGAVVISNETGRKYVWSFTDNTVAMSAMRKATPSTIAMQTLTRARTDWMFAEGVVETTERITSKANRWADALSRGDLQSVLTEAAALGLTHRQLSIPTEWRGMLADCAREGEGRKPPPPRTHRTTAPPPRRERGGDVPDSEDVGSGPAAPRAAAGLLPRALDGPGDRRPLDGSSMVAQVLRARAPGGSMDPPHGIVIARREDRRGAPGDGLRSVARSSTPVGTPHIGPHDSPLCDPSLSLAPPAVPDRDLRGPRPRAHSRHDQRDAPCTPRDTEEASMGSAHAGSRALDASEPGDVRGGRDVAGGVLDSLLRSHARRRARHAAGGDLRPPLPLDARGPEVQAGRGWRDLRHHHDARGEIREPPEDDSDNPPRIGDDPGPPGGPDRHDPRRPGAEGGTGDDAVVPARVRGGDHSGGGPPGGEDAHGADRARPSAVRSPQPADRRSDGGASRPPASRHDPGGRAMVQRRVRGIHSGQLAIRRAAVDRDRLDSLQRPRARRRVRGRGAHVHHGAACTGRHEVVRARPDRRCD